MTGSYLQSNELDVQCSTGFLQLPYSSLGPTLEGSMPASDLPEWPFEMGGTVKVKGDGGEDEERTKVVNNWLYFGRRLLRCDDSLVSVPAEGPGYVWAVVSHPTVTTSEGDSDVTLSVTCDSELHENTLAVTYRLLYVTENGSVKTDCRCMPWIVAMA